MKKQNKIINVEGVIHGACNGVGEVKAAPIEAVFMRAITNATEHLLLYLYISTRALLTLSEW